MVKCPRGTKEQINANTTYMQTLTANTNQNSEDTDDTYAPEEGFELYPELDDVRADKRNPPTTEDEITYLFVNHFLDILLKCWNGTPCLKPKLNKPPSEQKLFEDKKENEESKSNSSLTDDVNNTSPTSSAYSTQFSDTLLEEYRSNLSKIVSKKGLSMATDIEVKELRKIRDTDSNESSRYGGESEDIEEPEYEWKKVPPDEDVYVVFQNGTWYKGRVSRKLMDGYGTFFCHDGTSIKGEFINGTATGYARLDFPNENVYEGFLYKGYRHGEGLQIMSDSSVMYSGEWWLGKKFGRGTIFYDNPAKVRNFYKGNWQNGTREGFGYRQYPSGSKYVGNWKNGQRDGMGIMFWCNNDIYKGQWKDGLMDGFGEYIWNGFVNKTLSYPKMNTYRGFWTKGKRNGVGLLETMNGAFLETVWEDNSKNGPGVALCPNGNIITNAVSLFKNDKPALQNEYDVDKTGLLFRNHGIQVKVKKQKKKHMDQNKLISFLNSLQKAKTISIPIHTPDYMIDLTYHIKNLQSQMNKLIKYQSESIYLFGTSKINLTEYNPVESTPIANYEGVEDGDQDFFSNEEKLLRHALSMHLVKLHACYDHWATIACPEKPPFKCLLLRIFFWELLIQADVPKRNMSLVDIDNFFDDMVFITDSLHDPFERIYFWKFLHCLITLSWEMYGRFVYAEAVSVPEYVSDFLKILHSQTQISVLSTAFTYFLKNHIFNATYNSKDESFLQIKDLVPLDAMYMTYKQIGEPHSAKVLLTEIFRNTSNLVTQTNNYFEKSSDYEQSGQNALTITNELTYLSLEKYFNHIQILLLQRETDEARNQSLLTKFAHLGHKGVVSCIAKVCPYIMEDNEIVDIEYQLTFLEFYKVLIACAEMSVKHIEMKKVESEILATYEYELAEYDKAMKEYEKQKEATVTTRKSTKKAKK